MTGAVYNLPILYGTFRDVQPMTKQGEVRHVRLILGGGRASENMPVENLMPQLIKELLHMYMLLYEQNYTINV